MFVRQQESSLLRRTSGLTRGVVIRISLMRYSTDLKNVRGIMHHNPLSAYGRKESRPRTERPSERRAFCTIREREAKLSGRARTTFGDQIWSLTRHDSCEVRCEVCGFVCGIAAYEGAVEKGQRHNDTRERARVDARAPNPARHLKDTYVPSVLGAWGDQFSCNHLLHFVSPSRRHFELVSADDGPFERRC